MVNSDTPNPMNRERCCKLTDHLEHEELFALALFLSDELGHSLFDLDENKHIDFQIDSDGNFERIN